MTTPGTAWPYWLRKHWLSLWVSVKDRLPAEDEEVLIAVWCEAEDHDEVTQRWQEVHEGTILRTPLQLIATTVEGPEFEDDEVIAWMPKPPVPGDSL